MVLPNANKMLNVDFFINGLWWCSIWCTSSRLASPPYIMYSYLRSVGRFFRIGSYKQASEKGGRGKGEKERSKERSERVPILVAT
jgi:hypothetical protein